MAATKKTVAIGLIATTLLFSNSSNATVEKRYDITKYVSIDVDATYQQTNIKDVVASYQFMNDIELIGQAINYVLLNSGYTLAKQSSHSKEALILLTKRLPAVHRKFTYVTLENLLTTLVGPAFTVEFDDIHRTITIVSTNKTHSN